MASLLIRSIRTIWKIDPEDFCYLAKGGYENKIFSECLDCHLNDISTLKDVKRLWKRIGCDRRPFSSFLRPPGVLLFSKSWLWRQNFLRMLRLLFEWHFATLKDVESLWKRIGGNWRLFKLFLGSRGLLLFNKRIHYLYSVSLLKNFLKGGLPTYDLNWILLKNRSSFSFISAVFIKIW